MFERGGECLLLERGAEMRNLAVDQKLRGETGHVFEPAELFLGQSFLTARDRTAVARLRDRWREQSFERQFSPARPRRFVGEYPAADRAGHGQRRERAAGRYGLVIAVKLGLGLEGRRTRRHDGAYAPRRLANDPEAVAAKMVHMRIDGGDRRCHGEHGFDRIAAFGEDGAAGYDRRKMRRADDTSSVPGAVQAHWIGHVSIHAAAGAAKPRLRRSASAVGSRPRNAL